MRVSLLKCKLHRVRVTAVHVEYEGSCAIDETLMEAAGIHEYEKIHLWNVNNGERLVTYAIRAARGSGIISVNGAAGHKASEGDILIIAAFGEMRSRQAARFHPRLVYVDAHNRIERIGESIPAQAA